jgi:hypothetical protein
MDGARPVIYAATAPLKPATAAKPTYYYLNPCVCCTANKSSDQDTYSKLAGAKLWQLSTRLAAGFLPGSASSYDGDAPFADAKASSSSSSSSRVTVVASAAAASSPAESKHAAIVADGMLSDDDEKKSEGKEELAALRGSDFDFEVGACSALCGMMHLCPCLFCCC